MCLYLYLYPKTQHVYVCMYLCISMRIQTKSMENTTTRAQGASKSLVSQCCLDDDIAPIYAVRDVEQEGTCKEAVLTPK